MALLRGKARLVQVMGGRVQFGHIYIVITNNPTGGHFFVTGYTPSLYIYHQHCHHHHRPPFHSHCHLIELLGLRPCLTFTRGKQLSS